MKNMKETWRDMWDEIVKSDNMFVQIGRRSYSTLDFFLMIKDICNSLDFDKNDIVLDVGGGVGWTAIAISPFVKKIILFDFSNCSLFSLS